jgi:hypothetical protein
MWPYTSLLSAERPPRTRPVYDVPPVIVAVPRWPHLRALGSRLLGERSTIPGSGARHANS